MIRKQLLNTEYKTEFGRACLINILIGLVLTISSIFIISELYQAYLIYIYPESRQASKSRQASNEKPSERNSSNKVEEENNTPSDLTSSTPKTSLEGDISSENSERNSSSNKEQIENRISSNSSLSRPQEKPKRDTKNTRGSKQVANELLPETRVVDSKPIEVNGLVLSIDKIHRDVDLEGDKPVGEFVVIEGTIKNTSKETENLSPSNFWSDSYLRDNQQRQYPGIYRNADAQYDAREKYEVNRRDEGIPPGLNIDIAIVFDINPSATGLELVWDPESLVKEEKVIDLSPSDKTASSSKSKSAGTSLPESGTAFYPDRDNPFVDASYPQSTCGDRAPTDPAEYPVRFHPVYIDYNESNLQQAQSQFCEDALRANRETGEIAVQVGSFATRKRARQFRNFLETEFSTAEVGEPTILKEPNS